MTFKIVIFFSLCFVIISCHAEIKQLTHEKVDNILIKSDSSTTNDQSFNFKAPSDDQLKNPIELWATYYYIPVYLDGTGDFALRDLDGNDLGPHLSLKNWCSSAMEGSVKIIFNDGRSSVYNYSGNSDKFPVNCQTSFPNDVSKTKFKLSKSSYGEGTQSFDLIPYRTIAVDPDFIPTGSVVYIPEARGAQINIPNGQTIIHDGYFFAADRGGAIKKNHIDVFIGTDKYADYFSWISSKSEQTFQGHIIKDPLITGELIKNHSNRHISDL